VAEITAEKSIPSETALKKEHWSKMCHSKTATAPGMARGLAQDSRLCRFIWALLQIGSGQTIHVIPCRRETFFASFYTRQAAA
jgi:hypothetical protein